MVSVSSAQYPALFSGLFQVEVDFVPMAFGTDAHEPFGVTEQLAVTVLAVVDFLGLGSAYFAVGVISQPR